jgi:LysM repeat protein
MTIQYHVVAEGETLAGIARQYSMSPRQLKSLNRLRGTALYPGQELLLGVKDPGEASSRSLLESYDYPSTSVIVHTVRAGETLFSISRTYNTTVDRIKRDNQLQSDSLSINQTLRITRNAPQQATVPPANIQYHTVQQGETLYRIALRYNTTVNAIKGLNNLQSDALAIGTTLVVALQRNDGSYTAPPNNRPSTGSVNVPQPNTGGTAPSSPSFTPNPNGFTFNVRLLDGNNIRVDLKNHQSGKGFIYLGQSRQIPRRNALAGIGLDDETFNALQYCKSFEGCYDAINTYDIGIFSFGFIQITGKYGNLDKLLQSMQAFQPQKFAQTFGQAGIGLQSGLLMVRDERGNHRIGEDAWFYLKEKPSLFAPFIQAGFDPDLILEQYRIANQLYAAPALTRTLSISMANGTVQNVQAGFIFQGLEARSFLFAVAVNLGISPSGMPRALSNALSDLAIRRNLTNVHQIPQLGWRAILEHIAMYENQRIAMNDKTLKPELTSKRASVILNNGVTAVV